MLHLIARTWFKPTPVTCDSAGKSAVGWSVSVAGGTQFRSSAGCHQPDADLVCGRWQRMLNQDVTASNVARPRSQPPQHSDHTHIDARTTGPPTATRNANVASCHCRNDICLSRSSATHQIRLTPRWRAARPLDACCLVGQYPAGLAEASRDHTMASHRSPFLARVDFRPLRLHAMKKAAMHASSVAVADFHIVLGLTSSGALLETLELIRG